MWKHRRGLLWLPTGGVSVATAIGGGGGGAAGLVASLNMPAATSWLDCTDGDFATGTGIFEYVDQDWTIEFWFKVTGESYPGGEKRLIGNVDTASASFVSVNSSVLDFRVGGNSIQQTLPTVQEWHHIAHKWDASADQQYGRVDNANFEQDGTQAEVGNPSTYFGFRPFGGYGTDGLDGIKYAEIRVWNTLRSDEEIAANKDSCIDPGATGLVALYASASANTATVATIADESTNGSDNTVAESGVSGATAWDTEDLPF